MPSSQCLLSQGILPLHICWQSQQDYAPDLISAKTIAQNQLCFFLHETGQKKKNIMQVSWQNRETELIIGAGCAPSSVPLQLDVEDSLQPGGCSRKCWSEKRGAGTYDRAGMGVGSSMSMTTGMWGFGAVGHWGLGGAWGGGLADLRPGVEGLDIWGGQCR